jgi:uncharacterized phage infection (PIP) family protein YhgE
MIADLPQPKKQAIWDEVAERLEPVQAQMADALADRATTETDLRNLQRELNSRMVHAVNEAINGNVQEDEAAAFMAILQDKLLPELIRHYSGQMQVKVGQPLQGDAVQFINGRADATRKALEGLKPTRDEAAKQLAKLRGELDAALKATDTAQDALARNADGKRSDEITTLLTTATTKLASALTAGTELDRSIDAVTSGAGSTPGTEPFVARLADVKAKLGDALKQIGRATDAVAKRDVVDASKALTALSLEARTLNA